MAPRKAITEIAPPQPFLCVNRSPIRYGFRGGAKAIRYSLSLVGLMKSSFDVLPRPECTIFWRGYSASWWCWCYSYPSLFVLIISVISAQELPQPFQCSLLWFLCRFYASFTNVANLQDRERDQWIPCWITDIELAKTGIYLKIFLSLLTQLKAS